MFFELLYIIFILIVLIQFLYYILIFSNLSSSSIKKEESKNLPISVIICAKNEAQNLKHNLALICNQNHSDFEIILVNDHSTDKTLEIMNFIKKEFNEITIKIIDLRNSKSNKKNALTKGIELAKNKHLLLTDADCKPSSINWINEMIANFSEEKTIVLGYGAYRKIEKSWLNKLIRFETLLTAIQYFSYAKLGFPYMGVGRNIAYTKDNFNKIKGFSSHKNIKSGDDDLFVNEIATNKNTSICFSKDSFAISKPHTNFKKWLNQKRRHISTATHYKPIHQLLLGLFYVSQFLFWFLAIILVTIGFNTNIILLLVLIRIGFQYLIFGLSAKKLDEKDLIFWIPFLELFLILIQMSIFIRNLISKPKHW